MLIDRRRLLTGSFYTLTFGTAWASGGGQGLASQQTEFSSFKNYRPGSTILLPASDFTQKIAIEVNGTAAQPVTIEAAIPFATTFKGQVTIKGTYAVLSGVTFEGGGKLRLEGKGHRVSDCRFSDGAGRGLMIAAGEGHRVERCLFQSWNGPGISITGQTFGAVVHRCLFDNRAVGDVPGAAVQLGLGDKDAYRDLSAMVDECRFVGWSAKKGYDKVVTMKSSGNHVRRSTFEDCPSRLQVRFGARNRFEGLVLLGVRSLRVLDAKSQVLGCFMRNSGPGSRAERGIVIAAGNHPADSGDVNLPGTRKDGHPHALSTIVAGCDVDYTNIGSHYRGHNLPATATLVREHKSLTPINLVSGSHRRTRIEANVTHPGNFVEWAYLGDSDVGPAL